MNGKYTNYFFKGELPKKVAEIKADSPLTLIPDLDNASVGSNIRNVSNTYQPRRAYLTRFFYLIIYYSRKGE